MDTEVLVVNKYDWHHPDRGGAETQLREVLSRLEGEGYNVDLLSTMYSGADRRETVEGVQILRKGFPLQSNSILSHIVLTIYAIYLANFRSYDIVIDSLSPLPWFIPTRRPRITIVHILNRTSFFDNQPLILGLIAYLVETIGLVSGRRRPTVSVSPSVSKELRQYGYKNIYEIKNGVDVEQYSFDRCGRNPEIAFLGRLEYRKGADMLPKLARKVEANINHEVTFHIMGPDGEYADSIKEIQNEQVIYHGFVDESEKRNILKNSRCIVVPSRRESWGLAVLEANSCGTPAIGFEVSGLVDSIRDGETGYIVPSEDLDQMVEKIGALVEDDEKYQNFSNAARLWAEDHSWERCTDQFAALISEAT